MDELNETECKLRQELDALPIDSKNRGGLMEKLRSLDRGVKQLLVPREQTESVA